MGRFKDKIMGLFKTNTTNDYNKATHVSKVYGGGKNPRKPKLRKQSEDNIIKNVTYLFRLKKENEAIKDRRIKQIRDLFDQEVNYYKLVRVGSFYSNIFIEYESIGDRNKALSIN